MADEGARGIQSFQTLLRLLLVTGGRHKNPSLAAIVGQMHFGHAYQSNTRIAKLTFDECSNFFAQGLAHALTMMFLSPIFHNSAFGS